MKLYIRDKLDPKIGDILICGDVNMVVTSVHDTIFQANGCTFNKQWLTGSYRANDAYVIRDCKMVIVYMTYPWSIKQL
jgi:hypothetical protein